MGQQVGLYRVRPEDFPIIKRENSWQTVLRLATGNVEFDGSFMALEFLLQKSELTQETADTLFYPSEVVAPNQLFEEFAFDTDEEANQLLDYYAGRITYTTPSACQALWNALQQVSVDQLSSLYNSRELRDADIYPTVWHDDERENQAFNRRHITQDYAALRHFYEAAATFGEYIIGGVVW
ncbi:MAG: DUF1877 family protein [Cytophagaceae bacterium]|nr:MAG: DUF1877 family protein [Cytophagaceae bacterium]